jgi:toxin ParE1/3/4
MKSSRRTRFAAQARRDLRGIVRSTTERWDAEQSDAYLATLGAAFERLAEFPNLGRPRDDIRPGIRGHPSREHIILYRADEKGVIVLRVVHRRTDLLHALDKR